jgi:hypothetical protein
MQSLMALVGLPFDAEQVREVWIADELEVLADPDLEEGETLRRHVSNGADGYELLDADGRIVALFVYVVPLGDFSAFRGALISGLSANSSRRDVLNLFGSPPISGQAETIPILGRQGAWDRYDSDQVCLHFEYTEPDERLRQITIMAPDFAP